MLKGIYSAASGMMAEAVRTDVISNNLANVNTTGFKKDVAVEESFRDLLLHKIEGFEPNRAVGRIGTGVDIVEISPLMNNGIHRLTGNKLDVALEGDGFFVVDTAGGERYTRDGAFVLNNEGYLVNVNGDYILGEQGRISIRPEQSASIDIGTDGVITAGGEVIDRLRVVNFANQDSVRKLGDSLWISEEQPTEAAGTRVIQGSLEYSNVNAVSEMIDLITATRAYEMNQKMIQMQDATLDKAINEVGKPS